VPSTYATANNSSQPVDIDGTPDARFGETDSFFLCDLSARYRFHDRGTLFAGIKNLLDKEYTASRHPHGPRPGLPRTFNVGVEVMF
jgi:Fe(3+) dicitrate transport protein